MLGIEMFLLFKISDSSHGFPVEMLAEVLFHMDMALIRRLSGCDLFLYFGLDRLNRKYCLH